MNIPVNRLLHELQIHPILADIGASVGFPEMWGPIATQSIYLGFDPDLREPREETQGVFWKSVVVDEAVTADPAVTEAVFYFTKSPTCSSTLRPDAQSLSNYVFSDLFTVEKEAQVRATTLNAVLERFQLSGIDWLKVDSQGTDYRLFESLRPDVRSRVLALDIEPGLMDAYLGEDLFVEAHQKLVRSGFWLSNLDVQGTARMSETTVSHLLTNHQRLSKEGLMQAIRTSPGWVNARYLRTLSSLASARCDSRQYVLLWVFSLIDNQIGYAADIVLEYEKKFGHDNASRLMNAETIGALQRLARRRHSMRQLVKRLVPAPVKTWIKRTFPALRRAGS
ncbi:MAG: hypothetical protein GDA65_15210 [Nitrospira sp. CR1.1]|jgi:hypothetical protein|nr:hypothetical protein [Nitrospira sp. CR1.1]